MSNMYRLFQFLPKTIQIGFLKLRDPFAAKSYAQEGEDLILASIFGNKNTGFYVDVGAHHPMRFSNTYYFYRRGWNGINIDATPGCMSLFDRIRPKDINLEVAIANGQKDLVLHIFDEPALNSLNTDLASERETLTEYKLLRKHKITAYPLTTVLAKYLTEGQEIDFLSVDVEGMDLEVLQSNDWDRFRPRCVLAETTHQDLIKLPHDAIYKYLVSQDYKPVGKTPRTVIFIQE